jgi:quercetin dioxygenase-like cupin family protein
MEFSEVQERGLARCLRAAELDSEKLRMHISELAPGARSHEPHTHAGAEAFCMLEGSGTVEVEGEAHRLGPNEAIVIDGARPHSIYNDGKLKIRYLVATSA